MSVYVHSTSDETSVSSDRSATRPAPPSRSLPPPPKQRSAATLPIAPPKDTIASPKPAPAPHPSHQDDNSSSESSYASAPTRGLLPTTVQSVTSSAPPPAAREAPVATNSTQPLLEPISPATTVSVVAQPPIKVVPQDPNIARIVQEFQQRAQLMCDLLSGKETSNAEEILIDEQRRYLWAYWGALAHALLFSPVEESRVIDRALKLKGRAEALFHRRLPAFQLTVKVLRLRSCAALTHTYTHAHTFTHTLSHTLTHTYIHIHSHQGVTLAAVQRSP